ncbi:5127_t:CDS:1, partial [Cetraspora pellucida]
INGFKPCGYLIESVDSSTNNFIRNLISQHAITEELHKQKSQQNTKQQNINQ